MSVIEKIKPVFLLADSQLLFYKEGCRLFLDRIKGCFQPEEVEKGLKAAYIGASNNDNPLFYELFEIALSQVGIENCRMIMSDPDKEDDEFLHNADIILLAGGDTRVGFETIKRNEWDKMLPEKYYRGAVLIGVSAGAIQLGLSGYNNDFCESELKLETLGIVPYILDAHAGDEWLHLSERVGSCGSRLKGLGIPHGAGVIYYPDMSVEAVRFNCTEIIADINNVKKSIIMPPCSQ